MKRFLTWKYEGGLKRSSDEVISAVKYFFDQWDSSTETLMEQVYGPKGEYIEK